MGAALLGLAAGLMIVVPTVLWMSGWFEPQKSKPGAMHHTVASASTSASDLKAAEVRTMKVQVRPLEKPAEAAAQYVTGSVEPTGGARVQPGGARAARGVGAGREIRRRRKRPRRGRV